MKKTTGKIPNLSSTLDLNEILGVKREKPKKFIFNLDSDVHKRFSTACGDIPASRVLEYLMRKFLEKGSGKN